MNEAKLTLDHLATLAVDEAARLLTEAGGRAVTPETIRADIEAGAPANADGTLNMVHYAAWLLKNVQADG